MKKEPRLVGINVIGWTIVGSNGLLLLLGYFFPVVGKGHNPAPWLSCVATIAVFPMEFFQIYLSRQWPLHLCWILVMTLCGFGILQLSQLIRVIFILLNIIHAIVFACIVFINHGQGAFLDYFFKLYFLLVVSGTYAGFITIADVRDRFKLDDRLHWLTQRFRLRSAKMTDPFNYYNLGLAYSRMERYEDAVAMLHKAVALAPRDQKYHFTLGTVYMKQRKYDEAVKTFKKAVELDADSVEAIYQLGVAYRNDGCYREAVVAFEQAAAKQPGHAQVHMDLGKSLMALNRWDEAGLFFQKAIQLNPMNDDALYQMGLINIHLEKFNEAETWLAKSLRLKPDNVEAYVQQGIVFIKTRRPKDAVRAFKEALRLDPQHRQAHYQLGFVYALLKDFDSARREQKILKDLDPDLAGTLAMMIV